MFAHEWSPFSHLVSPSISSNSCHLLRFMDLSLLYLSNKTVFVLFSQKSRREHPKVKSEILMLIYNLKVGIHQGEQNR